MGSPESATADPPLIGGIVQKLMAVPLLPDGSLVLTPQAFSIDGVTAFFSNVLQVQSFTVANAQRKQTMRPVGATVMGQATVFNYPGLDATLTFASQEDDEGEVSIGIDGTFKPEQSFPLPIITWIALTQLGLTATYDSRWGIVHFLFHGKIQSGEGTIAALIPFTMQRAAGGGWQLSFAGDTATSVSGDQLVALMSGNSLTEFLPDALTNGLKSIAITDVDAVFDPDAKTISYFAVGITVENDWDIAPKVSLSPGLGLSLALVNPTDPVNKLIVGQVTGTFLLGETPVPLFVQGSAGASTLWMAGVQPDQTVTLPSFSDLLGLAGGKGFLDSLPKGFSDLPQIQIDTLLVTFDPTNKTLNEIDFAIQTKSPWPVVDKYFEVTNIYVALVITDLIGGGTPATQGLIRCTFDLDNVIVGLSASVNQPFRAGWLFEGSTAELPVGRLIAYIAKTFNVQDLPEFITGITLENVVVSYDTGSKKFTFATTGNIPVGEKTLCIQVRIVVTQTGDSFTMDPFGTIEIGTAKFTLAFSSGSSNTSFTANWVKKDGESLDVADIAGALPNVQSLLSPPKEASLELSFDDDNEVKRLTLTCTLENGAKAAFLLARDSSVPKPQWIAALGLQPARISTDDLGSLGSVLQPYSIALDKLLVVAASADAPEGEQLSLDKGYRFTKGFLLQGALEFGGTSYSYPFECRLGGDQKPKERTGPGPDATTPRISAAAPSSSPESREREAAPKALEANNNVEVGRTIGPVTFRQARLESRDERVYLLLDASLGSGGFALDLTGFNLNFATALLKDPAALVGEIKVGLDGLSIAYSNPPLTISGGLARMAGEPPYVGDVFRGHLLIKAQTFQITVLGSYGTIEAKDRAGTTTPSLFLYGTFAGVLGGPGVFFVTGLALGGGYNTRLALPKIEEVAEFPLVQAVTDPEKFAKNQSEAIEKLSKAIQPSNGDYWLAVGVKFDSFKLADSFALFSVVSVTRLQFALLGLTKLTMPRGRSPLTSAAIYAELAIRAVLDPEAGVFSIEGRLTQSSFVLAQELHLTGGFAFFVWFGKAQKAGDFVISLGGYHKDFVSPPHYPVVPRVGIHGQIGRLAVTGEAYLALTPSCVMAGQRLEAVFETDIILVAFVAYADFLIAWAPFHYDARIGIGICRHLSALAFLQTRARREPAHLGTTVRRHCLCRALDHLVHRRIRRPQRDQTAPLDWVQFQEAFLQSAASKGSGGGLSTIRITEGLVREVKKKDEWKELTYRIVNPYELIIETDSAVPCRK